MQEKKRRDALTAHKINIAFWSQPPLNTIHQTKGALPIQTQMLYQLQFTVSCSGLIFLYIQRAWAMCNCLDWMRSLNILQSMQSLSTLCNLSRRAWPCNWASRDLFVSNTVLIAIRQHLLINTQKSSTQQGSQTFGLWFWSWALCSCLLCMLAFERLKQCWLPCSSLQYTCLLSKRVSHSVSLPNNVDDFCNWMYLLYSFRDWSWH